MTDEAEIPQARLVRPRRALPDPIWAIPILALLIGLWLGFRAIHSRGPTVTITFRSGRWLTIGKTKLKYRDVDVGEVRGIGFSPDRAKVTVTADLRRGTASWLVDDTRFWIVVPRVGLGEVSGLETLISGAYIALDVGTSEQPRSDFQGLDAPPPILGDTPGRSFVARARQAVTLGSPVLFHRLEVGEVTASSLDEDGRHVSVSLFVRAPYDRYVTTATRFWEASGIRGSVGADGARVEVESLTTMLLGGICFDTPADGGEALRAPPSQTFVLFSSEQDAMRLPDGPAEDYRLVFHQSVRGLLAGAPVDYRGIPFGEVTRVGLGFDPKRAELATAVDVRLYPQRLRARIDQRLPAETPAQVDARLKRLVAHGLRGQLRTANVLTGQLIVSFDFFPRAASADYDAGRLPHEIPTVPGDIDEIQASLTTFLHKLDGLPVDNLGRLITDSRQVLAKVGKTFEDTDATIAQFGSAEPRGADIDDALQQVARAARAVRTLTDSLERHPESLIRGRE